MTRAYRWDIDIPPRRAYRGYIIRHNPLNGAWWVEKDGALIGWAQDEADARTIIDGLFR